MDENLIQKTIVYPGKGSISGFEAGTKVTFHFCTRRQDEDKTVVDDSKAFGKPMELIMGKKFKLEVWEACIRTMREQEVSCFSVDKSLIINYPFVAKTLRSALGNQKVTSTSSHCCGMMNFQTEGLGFPDLDQLVRQPENLDFILELVKIEQPGDYPKETWAMSDAEKLEMVPTYHEQGNNFYQKKEYVQASAKYAEALGILEQLILREKPGDEEWKKLDTMKIPLLLNYAQCKLLLKDYYPVIEHTSTVLEKDPNNIKALFRRAKAHIGAWNPDDALKDLQRVAELDPTLDKTVQKELQHLESLRKQHDKEDAELLRKLF